SQRMSSGVLSRIRYFTYLNPRRFESTQQSMSQWTDLANLSYGPKTIEHRQKLRKTFFDLRRILEKNSGNKLIEIGSYAVGASTPSSDLDLLLLPYANDQNEDRIEEFNRNMRSILFRKQTLGPFATRLSHGGIMKTRAILLYKPKVPIIKGTTRTGVSFDIQMGSIDTVYSTNYTRLAFQLDPRLILVYHWLRQQTEKLFNLFSSMSIRNWQKSIDSFRCCLFGGRDNLFTAFHLYMLVIHFAQATGIVPILMDVHPLHLSRACHWKDLTEDHREGKNTVDSLHSTENVDVWAPSLTDQLVDYYSNIDFTKVEINVGKGIVKEKMTNNLLLIEPFHDQIKGVCKVKNGATLMNIIFAKVKKNRS
ncbi:hypothetical protein PRIPAC_75022, partial [Pristionchus pacificus]